MKEKSLPLPSFPTTQRERAPRSTRNVTMQQIADLCHVSKITVGRTFLHPEQVRPRTRQRILETAEKLGYTYNALAATLGQSRKPFVGLIASSGNDSQFKSILRATQSMIREEGLDLLLGNTELSSREENLLINRYIQYQALGIVMYGITLETLQQSQLLRNSACPILLVGDSVTDDKINWAGVDIYRASYQMTEYLIRFGHRDIAFLCGRHDISYRSSRRFQGYRDSLEQYGIPFRPENVLITDSDLNTKENDIISSGYQAMDRILHLPVRPTAVMFPSDMFALGGLLHTQMQGLDVPGDISIVSMHEYTLSSWIRPSLTTIRVPEEDIAGLTIDFFREILAGSFPSGWHRMLPTELVIRDSCAAPRRNDDN